MKKYIALFGLLLSFYNIHSQETKGFINKTPDYPKIATPNVAAFNKYIDNPVSLYTGTPEVNVPIYNLKDGQIELPIGLTYNSSGIKVDEEASWVGLGWNLNAGGMIVQNVVGDYDNDDVEYQNILTSLNLNTDIVHYYLAPEYSYNLHESLKEMNGTSFKRAGKLNPDVFYFSYPGGSGKFIIDYRNDGIYILNRTSNIQIDITEKDNNNNNSINVRTFRIITAEGIKHFFNQKVSLLDNNGIYPVSVTYTLVYSIYPNGQVVNYEYKTYPTIKYSKSYYYQAPMNNPNPIPGIQTDPSYNAQMGFIGGTQGDFTKGNSTSVSAGEEVYLNKITTSNFQVTFGVSNREDYVNGKKLDSILIETLDNQINYSKKVFHFKYGNYFSAEINSSGWFENALPSGADPSLAWKEDYRSKRLKLISTYMGNESNPNDKYEFFYEESKTLPKKTSYQVDYWGYYNGLGGGSDSYLPDIQRLLWGQRMYSEDKKRESEIYQKFGFTEFSNRGYNFDYCKVGILKGIKYPTGGYTEYCYEPNTFIDYSIPAANEQLIDPRVETVEVLDQNSSIDKTIKTFPIIQDVKAVVTIGLNKGRGSWSTLFNQSEHVAAYLIQLKNHTFDKVIKTYDLKDRCDYYSNHYPNISSIDTIEEFIINRPDQTNIYEYSISVCFPDAMGPQNDGADYNHGLLRASVSYSSTDPVGVTEVQGCGLRIKKINSFNKQSDTNPVLTTEYEYIDPKTGKSSGILNEILCFAKIYNQAPNYMRKNSQPYPGLYLFWTDFIDISGNNQASNPYGTIGGVGYSIVKETKKANNLFTGYTTSYFWNKSPQFSQNSVRLDDPLNGKLMKTETFNSNNIKIKKDTFNYQVYDKLNYLGVNFTNKLNMFSGIYSNAGLTPEIYADMDGYIASVNTGGNGYINQMDILLHQLNVNDIMLINKTTTIDGISSKEEYSYNTNTLQLKRKDLSLENGNKLSYSYNYPNDYPWSPYKEMNDKNRISNILEEKIFRNNLFVGGTLTEYKSIPVVGGTMYTEVPYVKHFSQITSRIPDPLTLTSAGVNQSIYPKTDIVYETYDRFGNINYLKQNDANKVVYIWGYNYQYPVAKIEGLTYSEIVNELPANFVDNIATTLNPTDQLNTIQTKLVNKSALVTTYTYKPLVGITSATDPRGVTTYYNYDNFGRLDETYFLENNLKKVLQKYNYHLSE